MSLPAGAAGRASRPPSGIAEVLERRLGLTMSGAGVLGVAVIGWFVARLIGSRALFLLVYGLVLVLSVSWALGRRQLALEARRSTLPPRMRVGQVADVEITLLARRRVTTVVLEEVLDPFLGSPVSVPISVLPSGQEVTRSYTLAPRLRGVYRVGPLVATWTDPFGLTTRRVVITDPVPVIVHPATELVHDRVLSREWEDPPIRPPVSKSWPTGFEFYGMRDYVLGDDPRRIVWRATARTLDATLGTGRYLVREAEQGITDRVMMIVDTDTRHHSPGRPSETFELAVRTVASLGVRHLADGMSVIVEANRGRVCGPLRGGGQRLVLLDAMAAVDRQREPVTLALDRVLAQARRNSHHVLVTPHVDEDAARRLRLLVERGVSLLVVLMLWEESDTKSLRRVAALGCNVVEVTTNSPLDIVFRRVLATGARV